ncbi:unnamed protein product [Hyaloperonospora brassicae]|uniref:Uncharacterized protein n=1 Tax=Hyaloperonospora brassicae TaxID=162125 RepID=A0AAV0U2I8_HYABA|nr:unnamed protein product [Hyaloperonospora brassicae]
MKTSRAQQLLLPSAPPARALRYRRKVPPLPAEKPQVEEPQPQLPGRVPAPSPPASKQQLTELQQTQNAQPRARAQELPESRPRRRSPADRRFRSESRRSKQPPLLKQLLWKAKAMQPTPATLARTLVQQQRECTKEAELVQEVTKEKRVDAAARVASSTFVVGLSSQETQSGSEDETIFLPFTRDVVPAVRTSTAWQVGKREENGVGGPDRGDAAGPVTLSEEVLDDEGGLDQAAASTRVTQRQKYKLKQKQRRGAAKEKKRMQHQMKQGHEQLYAREDTGSSLDDENTTTDAVDSPTMMDTSEPDAAVCRSVLVEVKEVEPFIVVGDVACPVVAGSDEELGVATAAPDEGELDEASAQEETVQGSCQSMIDALDEIRVECRESFVVAKSGFDAASSYDFFKHRFCEIQRDTGIVYY